MFSRGTYCLLKLVVSITKGRHNILLLLFQNANHWHGIKGTSSSDRDIEMIRKVSPVVSIEYDGIDNNIYAE